MCPAMCDFHCEHRRNKMDASLSLWRLSSSEDVAGKDLKPLCSAAMFAPEWLSNHQLKCKETIWHYKITRRIFAVGPILNKIQKPCRKPNFLWKEPEEKGGVLGTEAGCCSSTPCKQHYWRTGTPASALPVAPLDTSLLIPSEVWAHPSLGSKQGSLLLVFIPSCRNSNKALSEGFLPGL